MSARVVQPADELLLERWYRSMAILLDPKWDAEPAPEKDELSARLEMACGIGG